MEKLVYIKNSGVISEGNYAYTLYYSEFPEEVWGPEWEIMPPVNCQDTTPEKTTISSEVTVNTTILFKTAPEISCFSMEYCTYGMLALAWIDLDKLDEYPEDGRCVLKFGMEKEKVQELLEPYIYQPFKE